jgi:hypothetical protein
VSVIRGTEVVGAVGAGYQPDAAVYDDADGYVYVASLGFDILTVIEGTTAVGTVDVSYDSSTLTYDPNDSDVYWGSSNGNLSVIHGLSEIGWISLGYGEIAPTYDPANGLLYIAEGDLYTVTGARFVSSEILPGGASSATYDPGSDYLYVVGDQYGWYSTASGWSTTFNVLEGRNVTGSFQISEYGAPGTYDPRNGYVYIPTPQSTNVTVLLPRYPVTFSETGLPRGSEWWINVTGSRLAFSNNTTFSWTEANGSFPFSAGTAVANYSSAGGLFDMIGSSVTVRVGFGPPTYLGLPVAEGYLILGLGIVTLGAIGTAWIVLSTFRGRVPPTAPP